MQPFLYRYGKSSEHVCYCYFTHQSSIWKPSTPVDILKDSLLALHYKRRLFSLKKGCFNASLGVNLSEGSNFSNPCSKSIRSPPEWSTCCIIRFCIHNHAVSLRRINTTKKVDDQNCQVYSEVNAAVRDRTLNRGNLRTALILSLETAPSGQFNSRPCLKYFSNRRLPKYAITTVSIESIHNLII